MSLNPAPWELKEELARTYGVKHMSTPSPQSAPFPLPYYIRRKSLFITQAEISKLILPMSLSTWGAATVCHYLLVKVML